MRDYEKDILTVMGLSLGFVISLTAFFLIRIFRESRRILALQRSMLVHEITSREMERKKIGEDLHDDLGPLLSYARMMLSQLQVQTEEQIALKSNVDNALQEGLQAVRTLSFTLVPPDFETRTFNSAVQLLCDRLLHPSSINFSLNLNDEVMQIAVNKRLHLYRILQELLHNTVRHSGASLVSISLKRLPDGLFQLDYRDNGKGITDAAQTKGIGFRNIHNRAQMIQGITELPLNSGGFQFFLTFSP